MSRPAWPSGAPKVGASAQRSRTIDPKDIEEYRRDFAEAGIELMSMSAATGDGTAAVLQKLWEFLDHTRRAP